MNSKWVHDKFNRHLTDEEVDLLIKVRDLMAGDEPPSEYICWNLLFAQTGIYSGTGVADAYDAKYSLEDIMEAVGGPARSLYLSIGEALCHDGTMENYIGLQKGVNPTAFAYSPEARLCWIDRMIDARAI